MTKFSKLKLQPAMEIISKKKISSPKSSIRESIISSLDKQTQTIVFKSLFISNKNTSISKNKQTKITDPDLTGIMKMDDT